MANQKPTSGDPGPIVVYGATGYTGKLICAELASRGAPIVAAGRSAAKLEALAAELGDQAEVEVAAVSLSDPPAIRELLGRGPVVIGCAGPFTLHGGPLIEAAAETGTHYLDTTGEQPFIRDAFERHGNAAASSGSALASGMGFDYLPGDMLAALTADGLGPIDEMTLAYSVRGFGTTRGTALSALEMIKGGDLVWHEGELRGTSRHVGDGSFEFPSPIGSRRVGRYPAGEQVTVPRHVDVRSLRTVIDLRSLIGVPLGPLGAMAMTGSGLAMSTPLRGVAGKLIGRLPEGPSERGRGAARFTIVCEARAGSRTRRGVLRGSDVYGLTAAILAEASTRMARPGYERSGALAPSQAFDPESFLATLEPFGIRVEVEPI